MVNLEKNKITNIIKFSKHIFTHLIHLYNNKNNTMIELNNVHESNILELIFICYTRYKFISNGNNQASILPSIKKKLKTQLNIKVELFGSLFNTSNYTFGSFFYDCEKYFGSIGNYFNINIKKGYYELNPPFDTKLINAMFKKIIKEFNEGEINKFALLYLIIIPESYLMMNKIPIQLEQYIKYFTIINKTEFPYLVYDRKFKASTLKNIVNTNIILLHNEYINNYVKNNINNLEHVFKK